MLTIYLASTNPGKLREFRHAAEGREVEVELLPGIENLPVCVEDGKTFEANACKKALYYSQWTDGMIFADDSGISVDALGSAPESIPPVMQDPMRTMKPTTGSCFANWRAFLRRTVPPIMSA